MIMALTVRPGEFTAETTELLQQHHSMRVLDMGTAVESDPARAAEVAKQTAISLQLAQAEAHSRFGAALRNLR